MKLDFSSFLLPPFRTISSFLPFFEYFRVRKGGNVIDTFAKVLNKRRSE